MRPQYGQFFRPSSPRSATVAILIASAATFVLAFFGLGAQLEVLAFLPQAALARPWTFLTYPIAPAGPPGAILFVLILYYWFYNIGNQVESELGKPSFVAVFFGLALAGSVAIGAAGFLTGINFPLVGLWLPVAAISMAWAARNGDAEVRFMFVIPLKAKWLGLLLAVLIFFSYGSANPLIGASALVPLALGWAFGKNRLPIRYGRVMPDLEAKRRAERERQRSDDYMSDVYRSKREREERERLRKLFESSLEDDPDDKH